MEGWELAGDFFWFFFADGFHRFQPMPLTRIRCKSPDLLAEPDILYTAFKRPHRIYTGRWNTKWRPRGKEETWRKSEERQGVGENWGSMSKTQLQWNPSMSCSPVDSPFAGLTLTLGLSSIQNSERSALTIGIGPAWVEFILFLFHNPRITAMYTSPYGGSLWLSKLFLIKYGLPLKKLSERCELN